MYEELDDYINGYSGSYNLANEWDYAYKYAMELTKEFSEDDWNKLIKELPFKSNKWKFLFMDCLASVNDSIAIEVLHILLNSNDNDVFVKCVWLLHFFDYDKIDYLDEIIDKINVHMPVCSQFQKNIYEEFLKKKCNISR